MVMAIVPQVLDSKIIPQIPIALQLTSDRSCLSVNHEQMKVTRTFVQDVAALTFLDRIFVLYLLSCFNHQPLPAHVCFDFT
jgi:hypothetical protein